jgi:trehalose 6-phosphate phosphatase
VLGRLASRYARVAVLSGRPVSFLVEHLAGGGAGGTEFVGLYGMERCRRSGAAALTVEESAEAAPWRQPLAAVAARAESAAPPGVTVERKGLAVTIHYRRAPDQAGWAAGFAAEAAGGTGLVAHPGKMSVELRPPVSTDKGTVVAELAAGLLSVFFAGDDIGDLPAFAALARLRDDGVSTFAVAVSGAETPAEVLAAADAVVDGPEGLLHLLHLLEPPGPSGETAAG